MRRFVPSVTVFTVALMLTLPVRSQHRPNGPYFTSPLSLSYGYDDNFVANGTALDDKVFLLTSPSLAWRKSTHRTRLSMDYEPEFEVFTRHREFDAWNHSAILRVNHRLNGRAAIDVGEYFLSTQDPSRRLDNSLLLLPRGLFQQNAFYTELGYRLDHRTKFIFRGDNAITRTSLTGPVAGKLNQVSASGTASVERTFGSHHTLTGNVGYLWVRPLDTKLFGGATGVEILNAGYIYTPNPGLLFRFFGGVVRGHPSAFTGAAAVEKRFGSTWLAAGYRRYLNFFGSMPGSGATQLDTPFAVGLAPDSIYQVVSLRAWGNITKRIGIEASGQRALIGLSRQNRQIKGGVGSLRIDYKLTARLTLFASTEYYGQNINEFAGMPMSRARYFGGLKIALTRPPEPENPPRKRGLPPDDSQKGEPRLPEDNTDGK